MDLHRTSHTPRSTPLKTKAAKISLAERRKSKTLPAEQSPQAGESQTRTSKAQRRMDRIAYARHRRYHNARRLCARRLGHDVTKCFRKVAALSQASSSTLRNERRRSCTQPSDEPSLEWRAAQSSDRRRAPARGSPALPRLGDPAGVATLSLSRDMLAASRMRHSIRPRGVWWLDVWFAP
jgi:hypothetical protein